MVSKKDAFERKLVNQIIKDRSMVETGTDLINTLDNLKKNEYMLITTNLIPWKFSVFQSHGRELLRTRAEKTRKFAKHANKVELIKRGDDRDNWTYQFSQMNMKPFDLIKNAYSNAKQGFYSGYSYIPLVGNDKRKRIVPLIECIEGSLLFSYAKQFCDGIEVRPYDDSQKVAEEGTSIIVGVPSRTPKRGRYRFRVDHVPIKATRLNKMLGSATVSNHACALLDYGELRYQYLDDKIGSREFVFDAHDIAGILAIVENYAKKGNEVPGESCYQVVPNPAMIERYKKMKQQCVIEDFKDGEKRLYPLNKPERESFLQGCAIKSGVENCFMPANEADAENYIKYWLK